MTESLGREAGQALRWNTLATFSLLISQLLQLLVLARWLSPAQFGLAATVMAVIGFAQGFTDLGLANALVQRTEVSDKVWRSAFWFCVLAGTGLGLLLAGSSPWLEKIFHLQGFALILSLAAFLLPWTGAASVFQSELQRRLRFSYLAKVEIVAAWSALAVALLWAHWRPESMALIAGQGALALLRCLGFSFAFPLRILKGFFHWVDLKPLMAFGGYQMGDRVLAIAALNLDRLLVARFLGVEAAGFYTVASQIALRPMALFGPMVLKTLFPLFTRMQEDKSRLAASFLRALSILSPGAALIYALMVGLADPLVRLVLGAQWIPAIPVLQILSGLGFIWVITNPVGSLMLALGRVQTGFWLTALVLVSNVLGLSIGSQYGIQGAAWGMVIAALLMTPCDFIVLRHWVGMQPFSLSIAAGWALPAAVFAALVMRGITLNGEAAAWVGLIFKGCIGVLAFASALFVLQRKRMWETLADFKGRWTKT